jgi:hypothetical protein
VIIMRKTVTALAAATIVASIAAPASAQNGPGWWPSAFIAGVFAGAVVGSQVARPYYPGPVYFEYSQPGPTYYEVYPPQFFGPPPPDPCWRGRQRVC